MVFPYSTLCAGVTFSILLTAATVASQSGPKLAAANTPTVLPIAPMLMPLCPNEHVLDSTSSLIFPGKSWRTMTVEQQTYHPINLVFLNLAGIPSTDQVTQVTPCLQSWGIARGSVVRIRKQYRVADFPAMWTEVLVMSTSKDIFIVFRATDDDWVADFNCMYTEDLRQVFRAPAGSGKLQLHKGFWAAYEAVDNQLGNEINKAALRIKAANPFTNPSVWFIGHSLGGALGSIAALKLENNPLFIGNIAGVITYGMPRVGNKAWQTLYNSKLQTVTLRWANHRDFVSALPSKDQVCVSTNAKVLYSFRHVGRAAQLCPNSNGMEEFRTFAKGTEGSCASAEFLSISTHLIGHYFDGWRRAYARKYGIPKGLMLSSSIHVRSVMCAQCATAVKQYPLPDNKAARNDGVVTCINDKSCSDKFLFGLVSWSGLTPTALYRENATCDARSLTCQVPIPGFQTMSNMLSNVTNTLSNIKVPELNITGLMKQAAAMMPFKFEGWPNGGTGDIGGTEADAAAAEQLELKQEAQQTKASQPTEQQSVAPENVTSGLAAKAASSSSKQVAIAAVSSQAVCNTTAKAATKLTYPSTFANKPDTVAKANQTHSEQKSQQQPQVT
eukprot:GHRR01015407.1.p1 GENE.GHRR01015407.1~~GHRR01015407.1.p1  ORF type:complete len:613 (+),score=167.92 GHRR01015407.1:1105-2943(+)